VEHEAKRAVAAVHEGDMLTTQMAVLKRFGKRAPVDTIALRRRVAAAVQSQDATRSKAARLEQSRSSNWTNLSDSSLRTVPYQAGHAFRRIA